ncbi:phage tail assembly chaperone [bacterium]|nr:phage tail assembly chaperone [bacterium]
MTILDCVIQIVKETGVEGWSCGETWESIRLPEGYEKPPKEEFEAKLLVLVKALTWKNLRRERNRRLAEVDWVFSSDYQIEDTLYKEWLMYRKALRDLPSLTEDPENPVWPEKPETPTGKTEGIQTPHFVATLMTENSQLRSKVSALERKSTKFELDIIDMKRRIQKVET